MKSIVMCGIPRSGSTLVWQILQAVFPDQEIIKTHPDIWTPDGSTAVISVRHPHDVVASLYRVRLSRDRKERGTRDDIANVLRRAVLCYDALKGVMEQPHIILRYEEFYDDHSVIYKSVEATFGVCTTHDRQAQISDEFSVDANRRRADEMKDFNDVGRDLIHGDHIGHVVPGYWKSVMPGWCLEMIAEECRPITEEWGYASQ